MKVLTATAFHHEALEGTPATPSGTRINAYPFFNELAHGIARSFMSLHGSFACMVVTRALHG